MNLENIPTASGIWVGNVKLSVKAAQNGGIQNVGTVCGGYYNGRDSVLVVGSIPRGKTIHFRQELIQGRFSFIVSMHGPIRSCFGQGIKFVNKDNGGGRWFVP